MPRVQGCNEGGAGQPTSRFCKQGNSNKPDQPTKTKRSRLWPIVEDVKPSSLTWRASDSYHGFKSSYINNGKDSNVDAFVIDNSSCWAWNS